MAGAALKSISAIHMGSTSAPALSHLMLSVCLRSTGLSNRSSMAIVFKKGCKYNFLGKSTDECYFYRLSYPYDCSNLCPYYRRRQRPDLPAQSGHEPAGEMGVSGRQGGSG